MNPWMFSAIVTRDGKPEVVEKVLSDCPSREYAVRIGIAMYCSGLDHSVLHCEPATVNSLVRYIRDEEVRTNGRTHEAVMATIQHWTDSLPKFKTGRKPKN